MPIENLFELQSNISCNLTWSFDPFLRLRTFKVNVAMRKATKLSRMTRNIFEILFYCIEAGTNQILHTFSSSIPSHFHCTDVCVSMINMPLLLHVLGVSNNCYKLLSHRHREGSLPDTAIRVRHLWSQVCHNPIVLSTRSQASFSTKHCNICQYSPILMYT